MSRKMFAWLLGTLGVITKVALSLAPGCTSTYVGVLACPSFDAVMRVHALARQKVGEILSVS